MPSAALPNQRRSQASRNAVLGKVWRSLTEPAPSVRAHSRRNRAQLLSALLLFLILVTPLGALTGRMASLWGTFIVLLALYGLSRTKYYLLAAALSVGILSVPSYAVVLADTAHNSIQVTAHMGWLALPVLLSGLVLPLRGTIAAAALNLAGMLLLPALVPAISFRDIVASLGLIGNVSVLVILAALVQQRQGRERAQAQEALAQRNEELAALNAVAAALSQHLDLNEVLEAALNESLAILKAEVGIVYLLDETSQTFRAAAYRGIPQRKLQNALQEISGFRVGEGLSGCVAQSGQPLIVGDIRGDDRNVSAVACPEALCSYAGVPIRSKDRVVGVIALVTRLESYFKPEHTNLLSLIGNQVGVAVENALLYQELGAFGDFMVQVVEERTAELRAANERLKALSQVKDEFVANVSHELRTPITNLHLHLSLLQGTPAEGQAERVATLRREAGRLQRIIEDLLRLSRLDQDRAAVDLATVDLNALVGQYVEDRQLLAVRHGLALDFDGQPGLPPVQADAGLLGQALSALLTNACNYTPKGGRVVVGTWQQRHQEELWAGFSVSDTGPGIPPDEHSHLFERFYRGRVGRESEVPGTGLGLAVVKEVVDRHGGRVEVANRGLPDEGATFSVWLPVEREERSARLHGDTHPQAGAPVPGDPPESQGESTDVSPGG
jgi:signal transduction histidine kinase